MLFDVDHSDHINLEIKMRQNLYQWFLTLFAILARVLEREVGKVGRKSQRALPLLPQCLFCET